MNANYSARAILGLLFVLSFLICGTTYAQESYDEITKSSKYIWAVGVGRSAKAANDDALAQVSEQIFVHVQATEDFVSKYEDTNNQYNLDVDIESVVETYSSVTLTECKRLVLQNGPKEYKVLRYIEKSEVMKIFELRRERIREMLRVAERAEAELKIDAALKHYYWAQLLTRTLLYPTEMSYETEKGESVMPVVWIPNKINELLDNISFSFVGYADPEETLAKLQVQYNDQPVTSLDYTYWDGFDWSMVTGAKDGLGVLELRANSAVKSVNIKIEYAYDNEVHMHADLESIAGVLSTKDFKSAYVNGIRLEKKQQEAALSVSDKQTVSNSVSNMIANANPIRKQVDIIPSEKSYEFAAVKDPSPYQKAIEQILNAVEQKQYENVRSLFTEEGYDIYSKLLKYGNAKVLDRPKVEVLNFDGRIFCRSIPMRFSFSTSDRHFVEDIVFVFEEDGLISSMTFALESTTVQDIVSKTQWTDGAKMVLIEFLENYKTAFALERLEYIESIFSDEAIIITGRKVYRAQVENAIKMNEVDYEYNKYTKAQYIDKLRSSFANKQYINLKFSNIELNKTNRGNNNNLYTIQVKQDYYSSNYGDSGYLFLMVDVNDYRKPIIHIRAWQPEPDPDFGLYDIGSF